MPTDSLIHQTIFRSNPVMFESENLLRKGQGGSGCRKRERRVALLGGHRLPQRKAWTNLLRMLLDWAVGILEVIACRHVCCCALSELKMYKTGIAAAGDGGNAFLGDIKVPLPLVV